MQVICRCTTTVRSWSSLERVEPQDLFMDVSIVSVCNMVRVYVQSSTPTIHVHLMYCHVGAFSYSI
jgi:hypothetical protein